MVHQRASIRNILCPTDFSDFSDRSLRRAVSLARWFDCPVTMLHVTPLMTPALALPDPLGVGAIGVPSDLLMERREDVEAEMKKVAASYAKSGVTIRTEMSTGTPWREIDSLARSLPADLVVLGTHGRSGWDRFLMGSATEKLIRRLPCPILTVGAADSSPSVVPFRRILCALDLTTASLATLDLAFSFAEESLASVTLLHVIDGDRPDWFPKDPQHANREDFARAAREGAIEEMYRLGKDAPSFCKVDNLATTGAPWREIVRIAEQISADLIVMGAHGPAAIAESFLGSTAAQTVRHAPCPVLLARTSVPVTPQVATAKAAEFAPSPMKPATA